MAGKRNPVVRWVTTSACLAFGAVTARLPIPLCRALGTLVGLLAYYLVPRIRRIALSNLDLAYGDALTQAEKRRIARGSAVNMGIVAAEFSHVRRLRGPLIDKYVECIGQEHLDPERGVLLVGAHLGNWEWMVQAVQLLVRDMHGIVRPLDDPRLDKAIDGMRTCNGLATLPKQNAGKMMIEVLKQGGLVGLLIDQCPRESATPCTFFGQSTWGTIGAALGAARSGVPVHLMSMPRQPDGRYRLELSPPIELVDTGILHDDLLENTQRCQDAVEALIRKYPEQWLWIHRRWKGRPALEKEWARRVEERAKRDGVD